VEQEIIYSDVQCTRNITAIEDALYVIGGKWKIRIIIALLSGHNRFNDLQRTIKGISARVLSNELKQLEINGLVSRVVKSEQYPVVVEYIATEYSMSLNNVVDALADWGQNHKNKIKAN
jgi:DNA-binding HxlR family transcriptional regulator